MYIVIFSNPLALVVATTSRGATSSSYVATYVLPTFFYMKRKKPLDGGSKPSIMRKRKNKCKKG